MDNVLEIMARVDTEPLENLARQTIIVKNSQDQLRSAMEQLGSSAIGGNAQAMKIVTEAYKENFVQTQVLKNAQKELAAEMHKTNLTVLDQRLAVSMLGREMGQKLPLEMTRALIRIPAVKEAINAAFNGIILLAFIQLLVMVVKKVLEVTSALGGMTSHMKEFYQEMIEANNMAFFGFTTSKQGMERLIETNKRLEAVDRERTALQGMGLTNLDAMSVAMYAANKKRIMELNDEEITLNQNRLKLLAHLKEVQDQEKAEAERKREEARRERERDQREIEKQEKHREKVVKKVDEEITKSHRALARELQKDEDIRNKQIMLSLEQELKAEKTASNQALKDSKAQVKAASELVRANEEIVTQDTRAQVERINGEEQMLKKRLKVFTLNNADYIRQMLALEQQKYNIERDGIMQRLALAQLDPNQDPKRLAALNGQLEVLEQQHQNRVNQIQQQAINYRASLNQNFNHTLQTGFSNVMRDMATANGNFGKDVMGIFTGLENGVFQILSNMLVQWISTHLLMKLIGGTTNSGQIASNAGVAASGAYASTAMIPIVGPELAPAAAATALSGAMSFETLAFFKQGGNVAADGLAYLHKREMVLPEPIAESVRGGSAGGGHTFHFSPQVQALDATGVDQVLNKHQIKFIDFLKRAFREGHIKK